MTKAYDPLFDKKPVESKPTELAVSASSSSVPEQIRVFNYIRDSATEVLHTHSEPNICPQAGCGKQMQPAKADGESVMFCPDHRITFPIPL